MAKVSLKNYVDSVAGWMWRCGVVAAVGFAAIIVTLDTKNGRAVDRALVAQEKATEVAFEAAEAKGVQHNGLIERMREMAARYITKETITAFLVAAGILTSIYAVFLR